MAEKPRDYHFDDKIFTMDAEARSRDFEEIYVVRFGRFAHRERQNAYKEALKKIERMADDKDLVNEALKFGASLGTNTLIMSPVLDACVAKAVVQGTFKGGADQFGRRMATVAISQTEAMAAAQGAHVAQNGLKILTKGGTMAALAPGLGAAVGEAIGDAISGAAGITNHHAKNALGLGGAMGGGAAVGALVAGPVGLAAGAGMGAVSWGVGKGIDGLVCAVPKGNDKNWVYIHTGYLRSNVCFSTYGSHDTVYFKAYWNEYKGKNCSLVMSAGQAQDSPFQLCVYDYKENVVKHFDKVYYRDFIYVAEHEGRVTVAHGKGENWGNEGGKVDIYHK